MLQGTRRKSSRFEGVERGRRWRPFLCATRRDFPKSALAAWHQQGGMMLPPCCAGSLIWSAPINPRPTPGKSGQATGRGSDGLHQARELSGARWRPGQGGGGGVIPRKWGYVSADQGRKPGRAGRLGADQFLRADHKNISYRIVSYRLDSYHIVSYNINTLIHYERV